MITHDQTAPRGVLHPRAAARSFTLDRYPPSPGLAALVERFWVVRWDLRGQVPHRQENLPFPCVNLVVEGDGTSGIYGVVRQRFARELTGAGHAFGIKFRAGAFRASLGAPVCTLTDRAIPIADVFGAAASGLETALADPADVAPAIAAAEACLLADPPALGRAALLAGEIVDTIMSNRTLTRVAQVAKRFGLADRALQRLFREHVGVGPKWVIQRFRLQDAADQLAAGTAAPALEFGYYDQAHFIRDFTALVGVAPAEYARRSAAHPAG